MNSKFKTLLPFAILLALSFIFHFAFLGQPGEIVFDELHFANYAKYYLAGDYYFDIHPPLGKLMIAGFLELAGDNSFFKLRFLPALFGSFFVLVVSWLAFLITKSKNTALIAGTLILFDNALLVQSRLVLMDIFLLFFGILALCFFFVFRKQKAYDKNWFIFLILTAITLGLTISIKWTGLATAVIVFIILASKVFNEKQKLKETSFALAVILVLGIATYALPFAVHFKILTSFDQQNFPMKQFSYGTEDIRHSQDFLQKFTKLNTQMLTANLGSADKNPDSSPWFEWPFNQKTLHYSSNIYFAGNTILWLLVTAFVITTLAKIALKKELPGEKSVFFILLLGYFANLLPFMLVERTTFLYHYLPALIFGILLTAYWLNVFLKKAKPIFVAIFALIAINFLILL